MRHKLISIEIAPAPKFDADPGSMFNAVGHIAVGRRIRTFTDSDAVGHRTAALYILIETAKLNRNDPQAWLAAVLVRLPDRPAGRIDDLLPWNWTQHQPRQIAAGHTVGTTTAAFTGIR